MDIYICQEIKKKDKIFCDTFWSKYALNQYFLNSTEVEGMQLTWCQLKELEKNKPIYVIPATVSLKQPKI